MRINNETKVGILIAGVLFFLTVLTVRAGDFHFKERGYDIKVHFVNVDGIALNSPVTLNGLEIGRVKDIHIVYGPAPKVELTLWIKQDIKILKGVEAHVKNLGFMGEKYIGLVMTDEISGEPLAPGDVIAGTEQASFEKILQKGERIAANIEGISANLNERLKVNAQAIDEVLADMRATMKNVHSVSDNINERFAVNQHLVDEMIGHANSTTKNLEELSFDLKSNPWKLLYKPKK